MRDRRDGLRPFQPSAPHIEDRVDILQFGQLLRDRSEHRQDLRPDVRQIRVRLLFSGVCQHLCRSQLEVGEFVIGIFERRLLAGKFQTDLQRIEVVIPQAISGQCGFVERLLRQNCCEFVELVEQCERLRTIHRVLQTHESIVWRTEST